MTINEERKRITNIINESLKDLHNSKITIHEFYEKMIDLKDDLENKLMDYKHSNICPVCKIELIWGGDHDIEDSKNDIETNYTCTNDDCNVETVITINNYNNED
jgi:hypothetical protein